MDRKPLIAPPPDANQQDPQKWPYRDEWFYRTPGGGFNFTMLDDDQDDFYEGEASRELTLDTATGPLQRETQTDQERMFWGDIWHRAKSTQDRGRESTLYAMYYNGFKGEVESWTQRDTEKVNNIFGIVGIKPHLMAYLMGVYREKERRGLQMANAWDTRLILAVARECCPASTID